MQTPERGDYKDILYFNSTRNYTLALLNAFNGIPLYIEEQGANEKKFIVPISFGNYEKAMAIEDLNENEITELNFNFLPRFVLSFEGMAKNTDRQSQKYQKFMKKIDDTMLEYSYNSVSYDFNYTLLLQARGLTAATQLTETILSKFNPTLNLEIQEFPLFDLTETQISIGDPAFEIMDEFEATDVNVINVTFDVMVRGNIYSPIQIAGRIETVHFFNNVWWEKTSTDKNMASYYGYGIDKDSHRPTKETARHFDGTGAGSTPGKGEHIVPKNEQKVIDHRKDYNQPQIDTNLPDWVQKQMRERAEHNWPGIEIDLNTKKHSTKVKDHAKHLKKKP